MDKDSRNRLQRATQAARSLIEDEYGEQLEGTFDLRLDGTIPSEPGDHLNAHQRVLWKKLVAAIGHLEAGGEKRLEAVQAYLREAAFTTLNRFVALKMLEARGIVLESVSQGDQSSGFKEFTGLAPGLVQLSDHGYRLYIESLFDEIGREVRVLFDRRDPASLLWPRRQALQDLLEILNAPELSSVWIEDETIGWVYQYFNGEDERKAMREASQAPRNSRELAVRNQFFTPRYVVQFLVDNTLGRTWFEMMRGETSLKDLDYFVRRQHEVFLADGEAVPEEPEGVKFGETPEHPFPVPFRARQDPRDLKILDPACGSGHFLLYTFDLLLTIYEEAWQDEGAAPSELKGTTLRADHPELDALRKAAPELILRHNLHGIDIDPRAAQIAGLALWLRAQRAFQAAEIPRSRRLPITRTNIVLAEPMPGEADLRDAFVATLEPKLGKLVASVFECMSLAGEAGYLLRIEEQIAEAIRLIYGEIGGLFQESEENEWTQVAKDLRTALESFAYNATADQAFTRQLFADDAARGLGFIDVCSKRYDTILMNPPFGEGCASVSEQLDREFPDGKNDIYAAFVLRGLELTSAKCGQLGALSSRSFVAGRDMRRLRARLLADNGPSLQLFLDLGLGVLDGAMVETAAYVLGSNPGRQALYLDARAGEDKGALIERVQPWRRHPHSRFHQLPMQQLLYDLSEQDLDKLSSYETLEPTVAQVTKGLSTGDDFRFVRLVWEVPPEAIGQRWHLFAKGGEYSWFTSGVHLVLNRGTSGEELAAVAERGHGNVALSRQSSKYYGRPATTWSRRSQKGFSARRLRAGICFSDKSPVILPSNDEDRYLLTLPAVLASERYTRLLTSQAKFGSYETGAVKVLPVPPMDLLSEAERWRHAYRLVDRVDEHDETSLLFTQPAPAQWSARESATEAITSIAEGLTACGFSLDSDVRIRALESMVSAAEAQPRSIQILSWCVGAAFGRFDTRCIRDGLSGSECSGPFDSLPSCSPGMLTDENGLPQERPPEGYAFTFPSDGVLVDDAGSQSDLVGAIGRVLEVSFQDALASRDDKVVGLLDNQEAMRTWLAREFFEVHKKRYSKSRRKAPIYWQLATPTASFSAWLYYHRLTRDTLFRLLGDHVTPKLQHEERKLTDLAQDGSPTPTAKQRKELEAQENFVGELRAFREEVARAAPLWNPNLNDGVVLNFAPLWRLVPQHTTWQKDCKSVWDKLCEGDYDWAHLAMHLWPERVVTKCAMNRSIAIAHGLDEVFWHEDEDGKWQPNRVSDEEVEALVAERTSPAVKAALKSLLEAPAPASARRRTTRRKKATTRRAKATRSSSVAAAPPEPSSAQAAVTRTIDQAVLDQVRSAIATLGGNAAKSDILATAGLSTSQWSPVINALLADGSVTKTGQKRGTRYHLAQNPS